MKTKEFISLISVALGFTAIICGFLTTIAIAGVTPLYVREWIEDYDYEEDEYGDWASAYVGCYASGRNYFEMTFELGTYENEGYGGGPYYDHHTIKPYKSSNYCNSRTTTYCVDGEDEWAVVALAEISC